MGRTVDQRVVEMKFDNKQFEEGASTTLSTLQRLKRSLEFPNVENSFKKINRAANNTDLAGLDKAITNIHAKFSALEVIAVTSLANITNSFVNSAKRWSSAFTIEPIRSGFQEYETQINAVQTILANTRKEGTNIKQVNAALDELNLYADKTIYKFTEMTRNIGTFTAAGVDLRTSVDAIQGIANLAAVSGSTSQQASTAMYQLSQALSTGTVRLMDWNSVVNAGMGGQLFQDALIETSRLLGTGADAAIKAQGSFRESLQTGWLTSEVLTETLKKFTNSGAIEYVSKYTGLSKEAIESELKLAESMYGEADAIDKAAESLAKKSGKNKDEIAETLRFAKSAEDAATKVKTFSQLMSTLKEAIQSGWSQSFRIIIGDFEEARKLFTEISNSFNAVISASSDARNKLLSEVFEKKGGRELLIDSLRNSLKGLLSVIKPVQKAFKEVFPPATANQIYGVLKAFHEFTKTLTLSKKNSENLKNAFKGLFNIVKLLGDGFISLIKIIIPINKPIGSIGRGILSLAGSIGNLLTEFSKGVRSSKLLSKAFELLQKGSAGLMDGLAGLIKTAVTFIEKLSKMEGVAKFIDAVNSAFERLYRKASPYVENFVADIEKLAGSLFGFEGINIDKTLEIVSDAFSDFAKVINSSFKIVEDAFESLKNKIKDFLDLNMKDNRGLSTFASNAKILKSDMGAAFDWGNILDNIEHIMDVLGKFLNWIKTNVSSAFEDLSIVNVLAAGGGLGIIYSMIKASQSLEKLAESMKAIPGIFGKFSGILDTFKGTLVSYQKDLNASALIKTAGAIAILAGALVLLSFTDTKRVIGAAVALSIIAGTLMFGVSKLMEATKKGDKMNDALLTFADGLRTTMKQFGRAIEIRALGGAVKKFAESIAIIAASIIALGIMYNKDKQAFEAGVEMVKMISIALVGIMAGMSILGTILKGGGMKNFARAALGILSLSLSLSMCINALNKLFKMEFPSDWEFKVKVLVGMLTGLGVLALTLGVASRLAGEKYASSLTFLSIAALLMVTISALNKLFKMELPPDWGEKLTILGLIFAAFGGLMLVMGATSRLAGGSIKAAGPILAMCVFLGAVVAALMVLTIIPTEKLIKGATAIGIVLATLGVALYGAGKITSKEAYQSILAMAITVGAITAALSVLAIVPFSKLLKGVVSLGSVLIILAENFKQVSKITNKKAWLPIIAMIGAVAAITASLYVLSQQPWNGLLSASVSLSAVLLSLSQCFKIISNNKGLKIQNIQLFLLATTSLIPIGIALYTLSTQPWENMLVAGAALSGTLLALSAALGIVSSTKPDLTAIAMFLAASVSVGLIAFSIYELSKQPWQDLLSAAASLSMVLLSMSAAMAVCALVGSAAPAALVGIGLLDLFIANMALVLIALGAIFKLDGAQQLMSGGAEILVQIGQAIGDFVGAIVNGVLMGISSSLPKIGADLSSFMINLQPFIAGSKNIDAGALVSVGFLAAIIIVLTAAEIINGIARLFGLSLVDMAIELSAFMLALQPFIQQSKQLNSDSMKACGYLASMIITLTAAQLIAGVSRFLGISGSLSDFGKELSEFGPYIKKFATDVKGLNAESVKGAASAAELMANLARKLPGTGGLAQKIFGERSLSQFGQELVKFGPSIKKFGDQVKGVKAEAVQGAASAAEIMAKMASKLPAQGGLVQKIFGEKSLSDFGRELVKFGPNISKFAEQVKNVKPEAVQGAASATKIMSNLANNLPNSETLWNKIFGGGQATLSEFGDEIVKFGRSMAKFYDAVADIDNEQVSGAVRSFKSLVNLAKSTEGVSATDLVNFSSKLSNIGTDSVSKFVQAFTNAGPKASAAVTSLLNSVVRTLVAGGAMIQISATSVGNSLCAGIQNGILQRQPSVIATEMLLASTMTNTLRTALPISIFNTIGQNVVQGLITGMNSKRPLALSTVKNLCVTIINYFRTSLPISTFNKIGQNVVQGLVNGINSKRGTALSAVSNLCSEIINRFRKGLPSSTFRNFGENTVAWIVQGMNSQRSGAIYAAAQISRSIVRAYDDNLTQSALYNIGSYAALGLKYGIEDRINEIARAAAKAAAASVEAARRELDERSPSKVMWKVGEFFSLGLANGIIDTVKAIAISGARAADEAIKPVRKAVTGISDIIDSEDFNANPVIRPVVDLSKVQQGAKDISSLMNRRYNLSTVRDKVMDTSSSFNRQTTSKSNNDVVNSKSGEGNTFEFNQYNYSPKALSRSEIYRDSNNLFSAFRGAVSQA